VRRAVIGATGNRPLLFRDDDASPEATDRALTNESTSFGTIERQLHRVALRRAFAAAQA